jgi:ADP-ribosylglycohydrolase
MRVVTTTSYEGALRVAVGAARGAGALLRDELHRPGGPRGARDHSPADLEAETLIRAALTAAFPAYGLRAEEDPSADRPCTDAAGHFWLVDPNDGTSAFLEGTRGPSVSIALVRGELPVLGVVFAYAAPDDRGDLLAWAEGTGPPTRNGAVLVRAPWPDTLAAHHVMLVSHHVDRRPPRRVSSIVPAVRLRGVPGIAYRLALAAAGEGDAAVSLNAPRDLDVAAGHALLRAVGAELADETGAPVRYRHDRPLTMACCYAGAPAVVRALAAWDWLALAQAAFADRARPDAPFDLARPAPGALERDAGRLARAQGCLLGQCAGDALGSRVEALSAAEIAARHPGGVRDLADGGAWSTLAGQPTDDTELALALARCLARAGRHDVEAVASAYAWWLRTNPFDVGNTTRAALVAAAGAPPGGVAAAARAAADAASQANGALMRVSPLGIFGHAAPSGVVAGWARDDAALTHPHAACRDASAVYAVAVAHAVATGAAPDAVHAYALAWARGAGVYAPLIDALRAAAASRPPADYQGRMGWVVTAFHNAFYQLLAARDVEAGIIDTVARGGDTDTTAAIAGALLGAVHGRDAVPWRWCDRVLTCRAIEGFPGVRHARPHALWPVDVLVLAERLLVPVPGST